MRPNPHQYQLAPRHCLLSLFRHSMARQTMRVAITGSHGFIGRHVAAHFRQEGHHHGSGSPSTEVLTSTASSSSILSERHLEEALEGVDTVIHTAAIVEEGGDVERFNKLNVDGARLVAELQNQRSPAPPPLSSVCGLWLPSRTKWSSSAALANGNPYCDSKMASEAILKPLEMTPFASLS